MQEKEKYMNPETSGKMRILVLDDEQEIVDTIIDIIDGEAYTVDGMTDPQQALHIIRKNEYDVVITDLVMPGFTGMDIANCVKENELDTSVIVITGYATVESAIQAVQLGVNDYIKKPFNHHEIILTVKRTVERLLLERKNRSLHEKHKRMFKDITLMCEISSILYQVHETDSASTMILDTIEEYFKIRRSAVALKEGEAERFRIVNARNIPQAFVDDFRFRPAGSINDVEVSANDVTCIKNINSEIKSEGKKVLAQDIRHLLLVPLKFHNQVTGFLMLCFTAEDTWPSPDELELLNILSIQVSPVMHGFQCGVTGAFNPEEKLNEVIRDYLYESQGLLRPVSFALFRITLLETVENTFQLSDQVNRYRNRFKEIFEKDGHLIWQTPDTVLVVLPGYDYFKAEAQCARVKELVESAGVEDEQRNMFSVIYTCLGYPQDGEDITDAGRELWNRLFNEYANFVALEKMQRS